MDLSVVILTWNAKRLLRRCLESVFIETQGLDFEAIVVDNASTDGTAEMLTREFPQVLLIRNPENAGFSRGNNVGINRSMGRYVLILNVDTVISDNALDKMVAFMDRTPLAGAAGCKLLNEDLTHQPSCMRFHRIRDELLVNLPLGRLLLPTRFRKGPYRHYEGIDRTTTVDVIRGAFMMVRREVIQQVGGFDEQFLYYCEEQDWCKRIWENGWEVYYYPHAEVIHLGGAVTGLNPRRRAYNPEFFVERYRSKYKFYRKHSGWLPALLYWAAIKMELSLRGLTLLWAYLRKPQERRLIRPQIQSYWGVVRMGVPRSLLPITGGGG